VVLVLLLVIDWKDFCLLKAKFRQSSRSKTWSKTRVFDQAFFLLDRVYLLATSSELFV